MEEQRNGANNYDLLCDREGGAREIVARMNRNIKAQLNGGMVWRILASQRTGEMMYSLHILAAARGTDHSIRSDDLPQSAGEGFEHQLISGVVYRYISEGDRKYWQLESRWDNVDINHIRVAEDYEWRSVRSNGQREENMSIWSRIVKDWSRPDGNILSIQTLWSGNFSNCERLLHLLEDANTANSIQVLFEEFDLHLHMREQYIARHETNPVAAAYSAVDSLLTVIISHELVATIGGEDGDAGGLFCVICHEIISIGDPAKQLPCKHLFHYGCTSKWFRCRLSCPLCRHDQFPNPA